MPFGIWSVTKGVVQSSRANFHSEIRRLSAGRLLRTRPITLMVTECSSFQCLSAGELCRQFRNPKCNAFRQTGHSRPHSRTRTRRKSGRVSNAFRPDGLPRTVTDKFHNPIHNHDVSNAFRHREVTWDGSEGSRPNSHSAFRSPDSEMQRPSAGGYLRTTNGEALTTRAALVSSAFRQAGCSERLSVRNRGHDFGRVSNAFRQAGYSGPPEVRKTERTTNESPMPLGRRVTQDPYYQ
jgi:hypothetical protein